MGDTFAETLLAHEADESPALLFEEESWSWAAFLEECQAEGVPLAPDA